MLHCSKDGSDENEQRADVHGIAGSVGRSRQHATPGDTGMEKANHAAKHENHEDLDNERCLEHGVANVHQVMGNRWVRCPRNTKSVEDLNHGGQHAKSGESSSGVDGRMIGNVV